MTRPKVLLTDPIAPSGEEIIRPVADIVTAPDNKAETLHRLIADADALVVRVLLPVDLLDRGSRLVGVVRHGVGVDLIPMQRANALGIPVANVPGVNAGAVAEYCAAQMLLLARKLHRRDALLRSHDWPTARAGAEATTELAGKTLGVIGVGAIGTRLAEIGHHGFRMHVLGHQRRLDAVPDFVAGVALDALLAEADFVVLCCPLTDATRNLIDARALGLMKPTAFLINPSRGAVIDEDALVEALRARRIGGAALDVYSKQPLARDHPLLGLDNVILTPHVAGLTHESSTLTSERAAAEIVRLLRGERPASLVNPEIWALARARRERLAAPH